MTGFSATGAGLATDGAFLAGVTDVLALAAGFAAAAEVLVASFFRY